ncbi:MAG: RNA polymerase sigma factor [Phycisphaerae bacterium]
MNHGIPIASPAEMDARDRSVVLRTDRLIAGDRAEFERLVRLHQPRVTRLAGRLMGWPADVRDVVQEVFLSAWKGIGGFQGKSGIETWLTRITINTCRTDRRRRILHLRFRMRRSAECSPAYASASDRSAVDRETCMRVRLAVQALSPRYREVVVLRYLEEVPIVEIGPLLGITRNAVEVRLNRAREKLKHTLSDLVKD